MDLNRRIWELIDPTVTDLGFELVRITYGGGDRPTLQVMAERPDGTMSVDDCADLSREISVLLDVEDPIAGEYMLEVSSPGIDRPLTRLKDFKRWQGHEAKVDLIEPVEGRRRLRGPAVACEGTAITFRVDGQDLTVEFENIAKAKLVLTDALISEAGKMAGQTAGH